MVPRKYIERMVSQYERMFGKKPSSVMTSPIEKNDHPETDESEFLLADDVTKYQSLIGSAQWAVSLGRIDITS